MFDSSFSKKTQPVSMDTGQFASSHVFANQIRSDGKESKSWTAYVIGLLIILSVSLASHYGFLTNFENQLSDLFIKIRPQSSVETSSKIVMVQIAEDTVSELGSFPWSRSYHAAVVEVLTEWGASAVVFDIAFITKSQTKNRDAYFRRAILNNGNVYLPWFLERVQKKEGQQERWIKNTSYLESATRGTGHINVDPDPDGLIRRIVPVIEAEGQKSLQLGLQVAYDHLGRDSKEAFDQFDKQKMSSLQINWVGDWASSFKHYSYYDLLQSYKALYENKTPIISPEEIKDKIVVLGIVITGGADVKAIPGQAAYPGMGILANVINNGILGNFIKTASVSINQILIWGIGLLALVFFIPYRSMRALFFTFGIFPIIYFSAAYFLFLKQNILVVLFAPTLLVFVLYLVTTFRSRVLADREHLALLHLATRDDLTGLYARRYFSIILNRRLAEAEKKKTFLALMIIDIDNFKHINDTYGHGCGDLVIRKVAKCLEASIRTQRKPMECDVLARLGGDEFVVLVRVKKPKTAEDLVAERLRQQVVQEQIDFEGHSLHVTISIGLAHYLPGDGPSRIMKRADIALYHAKADGRNRVSLNNKE